MERKQGTEPAVTPPDRKALDRGERAREVREQAEIRIRERHAEKAAPREWISERAWAGG